MHIGLSYATYIIKFISGGIIPMHIGLRVSIYQLFQPLVLKNFPKYKIFNVPLFIYEK